MKPEPLKFDYLILGSGIAGTFFALKAAKKGSVAIITKKERAESNTHQAQGGIAAVTSKEDSFEMHIQDTLNAGAGLCNEEVVRTIISEGPDRIADLIAYGTQFTERCIPNQQGCKELDLGREGGHSKRRVLHAGDITGREVESALLDAASKEKNITFFEHYFGIDLILSDNGEGQKQCVGVHALNVETKEVQTFQGKYIVLATGGCGKVYLYTTNPYIATGDGVAMAWRAGARVSNMEFIQFHPTCFYDPNGGSFLISEAVRGEGATLKNLDGQEFMDQYDPRLSLAPRDIVARAIDSEMKKNGTDHVFLDITHKPARFLMERFPNIYQHCFKRGIDLTKEPVPVVPAAHYQCGGVQTDINGKTSIPGLYAIGEVACTGLHGANRLASNSLLEAVVLAHRAAECASLEKAPLLEYEIQPWESGNAQNADELVVLNHNWDEIRRLMWDYVGIVRSTRRLQRAKTRIENIIEEIREYYWDFKVTKEILELRNIARVAWIIIVSALLRPESRGLHYTLDYPHPVPELSQQDTVIIRSPNSKS
ncbi:MAG: L-aspartate oxidase [Verrucomicrobiota bacterium]|nr:L-aspartate oxidase [Verrucomicrobiota bacterium]